ncbi:hypothetical protein FOL47_008376 [Perkinsus chesapeaki]|uniref:Uncharacterized protein n=1 Tax=Perkinsus chesapeaki TaxID=330153 RepID=A0A7J6LEK6_PERCH|nr:hypothetical protein FOL47_008376 [Perkinsus chesapeaki]
MQPMRGPQQRMRQQGDDLLDISPSKSRRKSYTTSPMVDLEDSIRGTIRKGHEAITMDPVRVIVFLIIIASLICFVTLGTSVPSPQREFNDLARQPAAKELSSVFLNSCGSGEVRAFRAIVDRYGHTLTTNDRQLCGHYALQSGRKGYLEIVSTLIGMGVDPREEDPTGMALIEVACAEGRDEAFELMLEKDRSLCGDDLYYYAGKAPTQEASRRIVSVIKKTCNNNEVHGKLPDETQALRSDENKRNYESEWSDIASQEKYSKEIASLKAEIVKWRDRAFDAVKQKQDLAARVAVLEAELKSRKTTAPPPPRTEIVKEDDKYEKLWRESKVPERPLTGGPADELISSPLPPPNPLRDTFLS